MRPRSWSTPATLLAGAALLLAGCALPADPGSAPIASSGGASPTADLQVSVRADGTVESAHYRLLCDGAEPLPESQHPDAAGACALVAKVPALLTDPGTNVGQACTMQYGGPSVAAVTGTLDGHAVNREFNLRDGCGIADWGAALPLLVHQPGLQ